MKIKKRLKYKSTLPKADFGMDPNALSNMNKQAAEETPAQGGGMGAAGAMNIATQGLNFVSAFTPQDNNDGIGMSHKASKITSGISTGLDAAASMTSSVPIVGAAIGGVSALFKMIKGAVDYKRTNDRSITSRLAKKEYDPTQDNVGYSFGNRATPSATPVFGGQADAIAKYGMPLYGDGGTIKYDSNFRPATSYEQKYNKETGLWEVGGAKPKQTTTTKKTVPQKVTPIYTSDPNDKRLKAYNDSLSLFDKTKNNLKDIGNSSRNTPVYVKKGVSANEFVKTDYNFVDHQLLDVSGKYDVNMNPNNNFPAPKVKQKIMPIAGIGVNEGNSMGGWYNIYKKPVQPVIYKKNDVKVPVPKKNFNNLKEKQDILGDNIQYQNEPDSYKTEKGKPLPDFLIQNVKAPNGMKTYKRKDTNSPWIEQYKNGGKVEPIYTDNPKDKRLQAYNDSLDAYNEGQELYNSWKTRLNNSVRDLSKGLNPDVKLVETNRKGKYSNIDAIQPIYDRVFNIDYINPALNFSTKVLGSKTMTNNEYSTPIYKKPVQPVIYQKPVQPVIFQKPEVKVPVPKKNIKGFLENAEKDYWHKDKDVLAFRKVFKEKFGEEPSRNFSEAKYDYDSSYEAGVRPVFNKEDGLYHWDSRFKADDHPNRYVNGVDTKTGEQIKGKSLNDFLKQQRKNPNGGVNTYIRKDIKSPWIQQDFALGGDPRSQSNIEAEQGEAMQHSSGKIEAIGGKKHPQGGTPIKVRPSHEYIYSDSLGKDKNGNITLNEKDVVTSFADDAKAIQKKYSKREGDSIVDKTKQLELGLLKQDAEQARVAKEEIEMGKQMKKYKAKYGMALKKFGNSGTPPLPNELNGDPYSQWSNIFHNTSGVYPTPEMHKNLTQGPHMNNSVGMFQNWVKDNKDPKAFPVYGVDGSWGTETKKVWDKYGSDYSKLLSDKEVTGIADNTPRMTGGVNPFLGPNPYNPSRRDNLREAANFYTPGQVGTTKPRAQAQDRQEDIAPDAVKKNGFFGDLTTGDKMQLASMLPAFGFNMGMGLRKADVEPNRNNPYENDVLSMMANRKFDIQNYLNQSNLATNTAKEDIGNNSTSVGGKMANLQKLFANQSNALGDITTKGQEMNNQYRAEEANTKNIIGESNRAESIRAAGINDQNKARKQQFLAKAFEQLGQGIATTGQSANQSLTNKLLIKSLSEISPDFDVKNMKDLQVGDDGYIVFKGVKTEFKMSDEGKIVMASGTPNTANAAKSQYAPKDFTMKAFANFTKTKTK